MLEHYNPQDSNLNNLLNLKSLGQH